MTKTTTVRQNYQLVNAKYKLDTTEIKFIMIAITQIKKEDAALKEYEIKVTDLETTLGVEQNYPRLKQFAKKIMSKPLEVPTDDGWIIANWFADVEYKKGQGKFIVTFSGKLKPYLLDLRERYVSHNLKYILPLTSTYSVRIYQLLKEYEKLTKRYFQVEELMQILQVPPSLKIYNRFKEKVLKVSELEIFEHTDIAFTFEEKKAGKKVDRLIFRIYPNPNLAKKQKDNNVLFDAKVEHKYEKYYGKNVKVKGKIHEHISIITPMSDDSFIVNFKDDSKLRFISEKALVDNLI
jgi:plasmid replication initiation protein